MVEATAGARGHMRHTDMLPYRWYDTPHIHNRTVKDFRALCREVGAN